MKKTNRKIIALLLAAAAVCSMIPAGSAGNGYASGQFYHTDWGETEVYTIQFSAGKNLDGAEKNRDRMLDYGNDAFIYQDGNYYYIMTGKFHTWSDAREYLRSVEEIKGAEDGFITTIRLPEKAVEDFEDIYYRSCPYANSDYFRSDRPRWRTWIPDGCERYEYNNTWYYYYEEYDMSVTITQEELCATSKKSRDEILANAYDNELACHGDDVDCCLYDDGFDITGIEYGRICYVRGIITKDMFYTMSFDYPEEQYSSCDSIFGCICEYFTTF